MKDALVAFGWWCVGAMLWLLGLAFLYAMLRLFTPILAAS